MFFQVKYPSGAEVKEGNELTPTQVKDQPTVKWDAEQNTFYTVAMTGEEHVAYLKPELKTSA